MARHAMRLSAFLFLGWVCAGAQLLGDGFEIQTASLPQATLHQTYFAELKARGGTVPLRWQVVSGALPPGLTLGEATGRIAGAPGAAGEFRFTIKVSDAAQPQQSATREFVLRVLAPLLLEWRAYPSIEGNNTIRGAAVITNGTGDEFDLTFIAMAVNETGKAYAMGYQHFTLAPSSTSPEIKFGTTLPAGRYVVHVDAVAEVPSRNAIYRDRQQTPHALVLTGLP